MRGSAVNLNLQVQIITEECFKCGVVFGLTHYFKDERVRDHAAFYCPNGHGQSYTGESEAEKNLRLLREEQARHQRTLARANEAETEAERLKRRVSKGTCPCCKRTFKQLAAHMKTKHPDYPK